MDLSPFNNEKFCAKDWVNGVFRQNEAQTNPETYASSVVMKLQLAIFEISNSLENTSSMVVQGLPRLLRDIELLQNDVKHFQKKLATLEQQVGQVEKDTTESLDYIVKLDSVKKRLQATSKALKEADNWTTLMADIEELFESNDLMAISQRLSSLRQSLDLLCHVSDYGERMLLLDGFRNRLEALASPELVSALSANDPAKTTKMVQVFSNMDRLEQLLQYYTKCRRGSLLQRWKELYESDDVNALEMLSQFYQLLLDDATEQIKWYSSVFHQPASTTSRTLVPIYTQALSALDPSPLHSIESLIKLPAASEGLFMLQQLRNAADETLHGMEAKFREINPVEEEILLHFAESLYQPFRLLISNKYVGLCQQDLADRIPVAVADDEELTENIHNLRLTHSKINSCFESTVNECNSLTEGLALPLLIEAWNRFLVIHLRQYRKMVQNLDSIMGKGESGDDSLHVALSLLQTLGEFLLILEDNETMLTSQLNAWSKKLEQPDSTAARYKSLLLEQQVEQKLDKLLKDQNQKCLLQAAMKATVELNTEAQNCIFDTLMSPVRQQISQVGSRDWANAVNGSGLTEDLPDFGLAPMEYITQVGQYFMMLPQHLEPFVLQENKGLTRALAEHSLYSVPESEGSPIGHTHSAADLLIGYVSKATANVLSDAILKVESVGAKGAKQLAADIAYLGNIFEDLGLSLPSSLSNLVELFRAAAASVLASDVSKFKSAAQGKDHRLVAAVRSITNLPSYD